MSLSKCKNIDLIDPRRTSRRDRLFALFTEMFNRMEIHIQILQQLCNWGWLDVDELGLGGGIVMDTALRMQLAAIDHQDDPWKQG